LTDSCATGYTSDDGSNDNCFACDTGYRNDGRACSLTTDPCDSGFVDDGNGNCVKQGMLRKNMSKGKGNKREN